ncbi:hypothetical protein KP509_30G066000 [Ceratopteris richardii]|uniref:Uncharacterized protein n=1 Tax=Ceratopteris richardii TaxID=49495 RepID=A0A8T2R4V4_CERRI|nr:hypothetical protein KP509_30G066000 [Ceratopteris richardii]
MTNDFYFSFHVILRFPPKISEKIEKIEDTSSADGAEAPMESMLFRPGFSIFPIHVVKLQAPQRRAHSGLVHASNSKQESEGLKTCRHCKKQYDPLQNHPRACFYHTAHFGGETKRKFESVHTGGTMNTPDGGKITSYWHCCGSEDPFDPGCVAVPHESYDE